MKNIKGFIGSIGDDLPSLIPLFFALMIFFAGLAFAFTTINDRNNTINTYIDSLTVAKTALSNGSYANLFEFNKTQENLVTMSNYFYGLVYLNSNREFTLDNLSESNFKNNFIKECDSNKIILDNDLSSNCNSEQIPFFVSSKSVEEKLNDPNYDLLNEIKNRKYFYYLYPVNLLTDNGYVVVYLVVMVW